MIDQLQADLKVAMLAHDELKVSVLRGLKNELDLASKNKKAELSEDEIIAIIKRESKKRTEAADAYSKGGASDRAKKELDEKAILEAYLPAQLSDDELNKLVDEAIAKVGKDLSKMGQIMGEVMAKAGAQADGSKVSAIVRFKLSS